ncbi:MAG: TMEM175 family protein, partial [Solirubrobacterales bacterium]
MVEQKSLSSVERGKDLSRVGSFSDGVFAIAITLLVLQLEVPAGIGNTAELWRGLGDQAPDLISFAISFAVIGRFWYLHHRFMQMVREFDPRLIALNLLYLAMVVLIPFTSEILGQYGLDIPMVVIIYIGNVALVTLVASLMYRRAYTEQLVHPEYLNLTEVGTKAVLVTAGILIATMPLVLVLGPYTPFTWIVLLRLNPDDRQRRTMATG